MPPNTTHLPLVSAASGLAGALTLTALHEGVRRVSPAAPRMDLLAMECLQKGCRAVGVRPPGDLALHRIALAGDVVSNSLYYALLLTGRPQRPLLRALVGGGIAGALGVLLPPLLGLDARRAARSAGTASMTVAWYTLGALASAAVFVHLRRR